MSTSERAPVRAGDTVANAAVRLRELVYDGVFTPGQQLRQSDLAERLRVGRTPLREAVRMLEAEGLLVSTANRGVTVSPVELGAGEELYAIRLLLEPPLTMALIDKFTAEDLRRMRELLVDAAKVQDRHKDFQRIHRSFHDVQLEYYSPAVRTMIGQLHQRVYWHQRIYMSRPLVPDDFLHVDRLLVDAIEARDREAVQAITQLHLIDAAIGLVLDVEPDHHFDALLVAASGAGIELAAEPGGLIRRPTRITWERPVASVPAITTSNVRYEPDAA